MIATEKYDEDLHLNIGSGQEISIEELAAKISKFAGFEGEIRWDSNMPSGTPRKLLDSARMRALGWEPHISLQTGISSTIDWYRLAVLNGKVRK